MAAYSPVCNIKLLKTINRFNMLDNTVLVLAHDVVNNAIHYKEFRDTYTGIVILDNSLN